MTNKGRTLPDDVVLHWPEIFGDIKLNAFPLYYLQMVLVNFKDGRTWEIRITSKTKKNGWKEFEKSLTELCRTYETSIENIDFKLDTERIKKDIERATQKFLKQRKL